MKLLFILITISFFASCSNSKKTKEITDKRIVLHSDTINVVKLSDTLLIPESTCRGCAYESSTDFEISDSLGIIQLNSIVTTDNNPSNMNGGSISKLLVLVPAKTGTTVFKLYKFWSRERTSKDSANAVSYTVEVKN